MAGTFSVIDYPLRFLIASNGFLFFSALVEKIGKLSDADIPESSTGKFSEKWSEIKRDIIARIQAVVFKAIEVIEMCVLMHEIFDEQVQRWK